MPNERTINERILAASEVALEECLVIAETSVNTKKGKEEDNDQYLKRISSSTEAKKKALKSAVELSELMVKVETPKEEDGKSPDVESEMQLVTPEKRGRS